ncbi:MAG TPA: hypothetical protein V6D23_26290, partial [Candidatus Obscuribacterales bacterium]
KLVAELRARHDKVYPMVLQGKPIWKLVIDDGAQAYVALTPQALLVTLEEKPDLLGKAITAGQKPEQSLLADPDVQAMSQAAAKDSLWFYGATPRLLADIFAFTGSMLEPISTGVEPNLPQQLALADNLKNLLGIYKAMDLGLQVSHEGLSFHSLNLYSQQSPSPEQADYLEQLRTPARQPLDTLLAAIPAQNYGVLASDRLRGLFGSVLPSPQNAREQAAADQYTKMAIGTALQQLTGLEQELYLMHLDNRYSLSLLPGEQRPEAVLALGIRPNSREAVSSIMAGLKLNQDFIRDSLIPPEARRRSQSASVKANMHTLQTFVEIYGVDHEGLYPPSLSQLEKAARAGNYWRELHNPLGRPYVFGDYRKLAKPTQDLAGQVFYEPLKLGKAGAKAYRIYGYGPDGKLFQLNESGEGKMVLREDLPPAVEAPLPKLGFGSEPVETWQGTAIHQLETSKAWQDQFEDLGLRPAYAISQDLLLLGSSPAAVKTALAALSDPRQSLLQDPAWQARSQKHLTPNAAFLLYFDFDRLSQEFGKPQPNGASEELRHTAELLGPLNYFIGSGTFSTEGDQSQMLLQADLGKLDLAALLAIAGGAQPASQRAKVSSVKANMHTLQTLVETYAVDWGGVYPPDLDALYAEASRPGAEYWRNVTNPYTERSGIGHRGSLLDFSQFLADPDFQGLALYQPVPGSPIVKYYIYGSDAKGKLVQDKGQDFVLSNS